MNRSVVTLALMLTAVAAPAAAGTAPAPAAAAPAAAPAPDANAPAPAPAAARLTLDTPIETIMADAAGKAVIQANMPGVDQHPMYDMFKGLSLRQVQSYSEGRLTDAMMTKIAAELAAIK